MTNLGIDSRSAGLKTINVGSIDKVYGGYANGNVFFLVEDAGDNPAGCSATSESYPVFGFDASKSKTDHALSFYWLPKLPESKRRFVSGMTSASITMFLLKELRFISILIFL